jgi:aldose 1-epimerase
MIVTIGDEVNGLAVDTAAGGRICSLVLRGRERILSLPAQGIEPSIAWGCYLMAPFAGRVRGASLTWSGRTIELRRNNGIHSIHGAGFDAPWRVVERAEASLTLACDFDRSRWPFEGSMRQTLEINPERLALRAEIDAIDPMPASIGWHPWFHAENGQIRVTVQSGEILELGRDLIPTGGLLPVDDRTDLRAGPSLDGKRLDDVYTSVHAPVSVVWPDMVLTMRFSENVKTFVICTHPQATCVEPMTAWPDAVRLESEGCMDTGLVSLAAGETLAASTEWSFADTTPDAMDRTLSQDGAAHSPTGAPTL